MNDPANVAKTSSMRVRSPFARTVGAVCRALLGGRPGRLWFVNLLLLAGAVLWVFVDPRLESVIASLGSTTTGPPRIGWISRITGLSGFGWRATLLVTLTCLAAGSFILLAIGQWFGSRQHRELKSWLVFAGMLCLWMAFLVAFSDIAWHAKQFRIRQHLADFEAIAEQLRPQWPTEDGELPRLGPFMAYPVGRPTVLMLLAPPAISSYGTSISAVERSDAGALRFELSGAEHGDWLEWHPSGSQPSSFVGGLLNRYEIRRTHYLGDGWHLVRYGGRRSVDSIEPKT